MPKEPPPSETSWEPLSDLGAGLGSGVAAWEPDLSHLVLAVPPRPGWAARQVLVCGPEDGSEASGGPGAEGGAGLPPVG